VPIFPSREWAEAAVAIVNADRETAEAGAGWRGDFGVVIDAEPGKLARTFVAHIVPEDGRVKQLKVLVDPDDLEELEPAYLARAPYSVWKALLQGTLDPVEAVLRRRIAVQGDVQPLIERARYKGIADRLLRQVETQFIDDEHEQRK
jgi:putative sterol carrier protein